MICSQGISRADESTAGRVTSGAASGTGGISVRGGRGWAIWRAVQAIQVGFREMATPKHGKNRSICRGGLQVPLSTEREWSVCPASQRSTTIEDALIHFLGNAVTGGPGTQAGIRGRHGTGTHQQGMPYELQQ
jgi:ribosomal protein L15